MSPSNRSDTGPRLSLPTMNVAEAQRWGALLAGGSLAAFGLSRRNGPGVALAAAGAGLVARGVLVGAATDADGPGAIGVERAVTIDRLPADLYAFWRDFSNLPRIMAHLQEVTVLTGARSRWVAKAPLGTSVAWEAELTEDRPDELIAWRSLPDSQIPNEGSVRFKPAPTDRGTEVVVALSYRPPAGPLGAAFASLFGDSADQEVREDLRRLKAIMETGEAPTTVGQSSGRDDEVQETTR